MLSNPLLPELRLLLAEPVELVVVVPLGAGPTVVARGDRRGVRVTPLQVLRPVVLAGAASFVLAHTHPDGGPPSPDDLAVTRRLVAASAIVGVTLAAHLVLAPEGTWDCLAA